MTNEFEKELYEKGKVLSTDKIIEERVKGFFSNLSELKKYLSDYMNKRYEYLGKSQHTVVVIEDELLNNLETGIVYDIIYDLVLKNHDVWKKPGSNDYIVVSSKGRLLTHRFEKEGNNSKEYMVKSDRCLTKIDLYNADIKSKDPDEIITHINDAYVKMKPDLSKKEEDAIGEKPMIGLSIYLEKDGKVWYANPFKIDDEERLLSNVSRLDFEKPELSNSLKLKKGYILYLL